MSYFKEHRERIVREIFKTEKANDAILAKAFTEDVLSTLDVIGFSEIAMDLLGVPEDSTAEYLEDEVLYFSREFLHDLWYRDKGNVDAFIESCHDSTIIFAFKVVASVKQ